ncbi:hypothetical protein BH23ACT10_BH23ACT10_16330 [soil metagenome]
MSRSASRLRGGPDAGRRTAERAAWSVWAYTVVAAVAAVLLVATTPAPTTRGASEVDLLNALVGVLLLSWATTGAIIVARRPGHPIGWLLIFVSVAGITEELAGAYAQWSQQTGTGGIVPAAHVALLGDLFWIPSLVASATLVPLLFPDGHLPSPRWRPVAWAAAAAAVTYVPATLLLPGPLHYLPRTDNPLGVAPLGGVLEVVQGLVTVTALLCSLAAIVGLVLRYRRARGVRRLQLRWFVLALVALAVSVPPAVIFDDTAVGSVLFEVFWALPPIAIGVAVLRYRLYELDRIVSRTITYAAVTAVLVGVYAAVAVLPTVLLDVESDLLVAAATLAAAGVFVPVRRRVQAVVDRRFNRARYDAVRVVDRFGERLRDDLDVDGLTGDVRGVVVSTVQPAHVSLWLPGDRLSAAAGPGSAEART